MRTKQEKLICKAAVKVRINGKVEDTTVGRAIMSDVLPSGVEFKSINRVLDKKQLANLIDVAFRTAGAKSTVLLADRLMQKGFEYSTKLGSRSVSMT